jgi:hypothetical protein|tara:strand:+ start:3879 stop:4100 length:222 start_codon:yes stop_codon:yes gene_type:complete
MKILKNKAQIGRKGTVVTQSPTGGQPITIAPQNLIRDPRAKSSIRGSSQRIPTGDKNVVKGTGAARKQTVTWY